MKLNNPFSIDTRMLFMDCWECWICGQNGTATGGLELHHIYGRISASPLNAAVLCKLCHSHIGHAQEEHHMLFRKTIIFLSKRFYKLQTIDEDLFQLLITDLRNFNL